MAAAGCMATLIEGCEASTTAPQPTPTGGGTNNGNGLVFDVSSLNADGKSFVTTQKGPDGKSILIVRQAAGTFVALSMECTHEKNPVAPPINGVITCPYHGSRFDLTGAVKAGPATAPLRRYETTFDSSTNKLTVKLQ